MGVRLVWRASPGLTLGLLLLLGIEAALRPLQLAFSRSVLDRAVAGQGLFVVALAAATTLAAAQVLAPFASTFQALVGDRLTAYVGEELIVAANRWPGLAHFEDPAYQDDLHRARTRAATGSLDLVLYGTRAALALFTAAGLIAVLATLHPLAPVLVTVACLPLIARSYEFNNRVGSHIYAQTPEARRLEYCRNVLLDPDPAKDVRLFAMAPLFRRRYEVAFHSTATELQRLRRRLTPKVAVMGALAAAASAGVYVLVVQRVANGHGSVGDVVLYGGAALLLQARLSQIGFDIGFLPNVLSFLPSLFRVLDAEPDIVLSASPAPVPSPVRDGIVFEDVSFTYPGRSEPALEGVGLRLHAGECVALVGHNGAGKTTIVKLLLRLYDPTAGRILLDGVDLRDCDPVELRREMGVMFQDYVRYELTAAENVGLGDLDRMGDEDALTGALRDAGAQDLLDTLPDGMATRVGRQFGGRELSEGEWQKLALARTLVRDGQILVLDEPTAALHPQTEYDLYLRFAQLTAGRTTLLISHRLSTVRMADRIVVLSGGRIAEEGSHDELVAADGTYARLFRLQAAQHLGPEPGDSDA